MQKILYLHAGAEMYGADKVLLELIRVWIKMLLKHTLFYPMTVS